MKDGNLDPTERRVFDGIEKGLRTDKKFMRAAWWSERRPGFIRGSKAAGAIALVAAGAYGVGWMGGRSGTDHDPSLADVRAAAFANAAVLEATGTCYSELDAEEKRVVPMAGAGTSSDKKIHPPVSAYEKAKALADQYGVPCLPRDAEPAWRNFTVGGTTVTVTGGNSTRVPDQFPRLPVYALLDYGSDAVDICHLGVPQGTEPGVYESIAADQQRIYAAYCPLSGAHVLPGATSAPATPVK